MLGVPIGASAPVSPSGGVGLIKHERQRRRRLLRREQNDFGFDVGGGVMGFFTDNVGIARRHPLLPRRCSDDDPTDWTSSVGEFKFWRGSVGVTFRF